MQKSLYEAISSLQEKKSSLRTISELKSLLSELNLSLEVEVSSSKVWSFIWNFHEDNFSGVVDIYLKPRLLDSFGTVLEPRFSRSFSVQSGSISKDTLKEKFLACIIEELLNLKV